MDRLKSELARAQKSNSENSDRADKLKKQNDLLDSRLQELKKSNESSQAEVKELRSKLRVSEHERNQLASKQGDLGETKKALQVLDGKRRDEMRERDRKIAELEKSLTAEKKRRELYESKLSDVNSKAGVELQTTKDTVKTLEAELRAARSETQKAKDSLATLQAENDDSEEDLLVQLEQHRRMLSRVAEEYGRLASSTVPKVKFDKLKIESNLKQLRIIRLERKLANTEGQVTELAHLVRSTNDESTFLSHRLKEVEREASLYRSLLHDSRDDFPIHDYRIPDEVTSGLYEVLQDKLHIQQFVNETLRSWADLHRLRTSQLLLHSSSLLRHVDDREHQLHTQTSQLTSMERKQKSLQDTLSQLQAEKETFSSQLAESATALALAQGESAHAKKQLEETQNNAKAEVEKARSMLAQQKQIAQKASVTAQEAQVAEYALQEEIGL